MAAQSVAVVLGVYLTLVAFLVWVCVLSDPNDQASLGGRLNVLLTESAPQRLNAGLRRGLPPRSVRAVCSAWLLVSSARSRWEPLPLSDALAHMN